MSSILFVGSQEGQNGREENKDELDSLPSSDADLILCLGDLGLSEPLEPKDPRFRFLRGDLDSPEIARGSLNYLGEWGYLEDFELFYVSGGKSQELPFRQLYRNQWPEEELSEAELQRALAFFEKKKPRIVVTHSSPFRDENSSLTSKYLAKMLENYHPPIWVYSGSEEEKEVEGTRFIALGKDEFRDLVCEI